MTPYQLAAPVAFPARGLLAVEPQRQALGAAARLDELGEAERPHLESARPGASRPASAPLVQDHRRPTTTALQLNETASSAATSIRSGIRSRSTERP